MSAVYLKYKVNKLHKDNRREEDKNLEYLVEMKDISKSFPGVKALDHVRLNLNSGEVLALIGENGAGKSTLMKILTGIYKKDGGTIRIRGREVEINSPKDAQALEIGMIHQELNLIPQLTVAENIFIGCEPRKGVFLDKKKAIEETRKLLSSMHLEIDPEAKICSLTVAKQQMVEIARAVYFNNRIIIMDEPTAALTAAEIEELFKIIGKLRNDGHGIIYISHRMEELMEISDRITVMRDGQYVGTEQTAETTIETIINMMVGRTIYEQHKNESAVLKDAKTILEVKNLTANNVKNVSFSLRQGEILGFAGLMGAGRTETMRALFGADPVIKGEIILRGKKVSIQSPQDAVRLGIGYLSEDRKNFGLALRLSVKANTVLACLENYTRFGIVNDRKAEETTKEYIQKINIKTPSTAQLVKNLSGGNQQKIVVAKWLARDCDILIFDEPTRGIDVGAKSEIYKLMNHLVEEGKSIIMISSELPELLRLSDRVLVMCEGRITGELSIGEATQEKIMMFATMTK